MSLTPEAVVLAPSWPVTCWGVVDVVVVVAGRRRDRPHGWPSWVVDTGVVDSGGGQRGMVEARVVDVEASIWRLSTWGRGQGGSIMT